MKVVVYGTLKKNFGNHRMFMTGAEFISEITIPGYKLHYSFENNGFPVAITCENSSLRGELYEIPQEKSSILSGLDRLEGEGRMYNRVEIEEGIYMYVGVESFWNDILGNECPKNKNNEYIWL